MRYDYDKQTWVNDNGVVQKCGHPAKARGCYACEHHGEILPDTGNQH